MTRPGGISDTQQSLKSLENVPVCPAEMGRSGVNKSATECKSGTRLTRGRSRHVRFEIIDALDRVHGPFKNFAAAQEHLKRRFRFQAQDDDRAGRYPVGWDIRVAEKGARNIHALSLKRLREVLDYDPETGLLTWKIRLGPMCKFGQPAGRLTQGYRRIVIDGQSYTGSHLAWFHFYGIQPTVLVDHKNRNTSDNRIENLRLATYSENARNRKRSALSTTGLKGAARFNSPRNLKGFRSTITIEGKRIHLGQFDTAEEAHEAYCKKAAELHGDFARTE